VGPFFSTVKAMWRWLEKHLSAAEVQMMLKVQVRAIHVGQIPTFQLAVHRNNVNALIKAIREGAPKKGHKWRVRKSQKTQYKDYTRRRISATELRVATWNVRHIAGKRQLLHNYLAGHAMDIVALQETWRRNEEWLLKWRGYNVVEAVALKGSGGTGLAMAIRSGIPALRAGTFHPHILWVKVVISPKKFVHVATVHAVGVVREKDAILRKVAKQARRYGKEGAVLVMGDMNTSPSDLANRPYWLDANLTWVPMASDAKTFHKKAEGKSCIDHLWTNELGLFTDSDGQLETATVDDTTDLSDHWPVSATMHVPFPSSSSATVGGVRRLALRPTRAAFKDGGVGERIACHNMWDALEIDLDSSDGVDLNTVAAKFHTISKDIYDESRKHHEHVLPPSVKQPAKTSEYGWKESFHASKKVQHAFRKRTAAFQQARRQRKNQTANDAGAVRKAWHEYTEARKQSQHLLRKERNSQWNEFVEKGMALFSESHSGEAFWKWISGLAKGSGSNMQASLLVRKLDGELAANEQEAKDRYRWEEHFRKLAEAVEGTSPVSASTPSTDSEDDGVAQQLPLPTLKHLNDDIEWQEIVQALSAMKRNKAPQEDDGITAEWLKLCLCVPQSSNAGSSNMSPPTTMAKCIMGILQRVWTAGVVPSVWTQAVVVPIPKRGADPTVCGDHRGISLMNVLLKLLTRILATRVSEALEEEHRICIEQAGFRTREEAVAQVTALYEVVQRRRAWGKNTFLAFIDFAKAYDTVPHEKLWQKLDAIGVRGRALTFIQELYAESMIKVRIGTGHTNTFPLGRGVRQGCPLSPVLFNIFINDLLIDGDKWGAIVPGVKDAKIAGLLFADDVVLIAESKEGLQTALDAVTEWADKWGMSVGHNKCGVMGVCRSGMKNLANGCTWMLQRSSIEVKDVYHYLGIPLTVDWKLDALAKLKVAQVAGAVSQMFHLLSCTSIHSNVRVRALQTLIMSKATYGGELLGMNKKFATKVQAALAGGLGAAADVRSRKVRRLTLLYELGIPSIYAQWTAQQTRAIAKWHCSNTWIARLCNSKYITLRQHRIQQGHHVIRRRGAATTSQNRRTGPMGWVRMTELWLARQVKQDLLPSNILVIPVAQVKKQVRAMCTSSLNSHLEPLYRAASLHLTRLIMKRAWRYGVSVAGVRAMRKLRVNGYALAPRMVQWKWLPDKFHDICPVCGAKEAEDREHLIVRCSKYRQLRQQFLIPFWKKLFVSQLSTNSTLATIPDSELLLCTLGGGGGMEYYVANAERETVGSWLHHVTSFVEGLPCIRWSIYHAEPDDNIIYHKQPNPNFREGNSHST
jgi:endonuclease/exonuclease/phosphatase family metal-dependent hydrolase